MLSSRWIRPGGAGERAAAFPETLKMRRVIFTGASGAQCFRDGSLPLYPARNAMSQNPMIFDQQVPRHIWESHGGGFWMLSPPNKESGRPKLVLLVFKDKSRTKTLTKP